ncbi:glycosyltransferase family 2 protein [Glycomyces buryatensis]|uniref:Glycosyltransferase family 2 protein n=1 Tax=Glycomyces buryatensis TaxID=2570927 RepID=A0A4S8QEG1_9ACTN|nr:glycosyltransferase family 2 protein [Glycomyces buryatensis]THV41482.1 glycosyltransferase family 2 protein [Glycomyces buryatensis]
MTELVSVIIPTIGRDSLSRVFAALARQADPGPFEVIVVVDGGSPSDVTGIAQHEQCMRVASEALQSRSGVSVARNLGVQLSKGSILGFLDDDTHPVPNWIATIRQVLADGHRGAAVGRIREVSRSTLGRLRALAYDHRDAQNTAAEMAEHVRRLHHIDDDCACRLVDYLSGGNCCVRADVFAEVGGFDPAFWVGQDRDLGQRITRARYHVSYEPSLVIEHETNSTPMAMLRGRYASGRSAHALTGGGVDPCGELVRKTYGHSPAELLRAAGSSTTVLAIASAMAYRAGHRRAASLHDREGPTGLHDREWLTSFHDREGVARR